MTRRRCVADWIVESPAEYDRVAADVTTRTSRLFATSAELAASGLRLDATTPVTWRLAGAVGIGATRAREETRRTRNESVDSISASIQALALLRPHAPVYVVDRFLWAELLQTDPPDTIPRLPFPASMFLLPAGQVDVNAEGAHAGASLDDVLLVEGPDGSPHVAFFSGTGRKAHASPLMRLEPNPPVGEHGPRIVAVIRALISLLALLVDRQLGERVEPDGPRATGRQAAAEAHQGRTRRGATVLSLTAPRGAVYQAANDGEPAYKVRPHIRRGHWRRQWTIDPREREVIDRMEREGKPTLLVVRLWIRPVVVGGHTGRREYLVGA